MGYLFCWVFFLNLFILHSVNFMTIPRCTYKHLWFIHLLDAQSLLVHFVLCRVTHNRQWSDRERAVDTQVKIQAKHQMFVCLYVCKFKNFVNTWHCSINTIYIRYQEISNLLVLALKQKENLTRGSFFFLYQKLVQINFIFTHTCILSMYSYKKIVVNKFCSL
jgi:hypothetical protein